MTRSLQSGLYPCGRIWWSVRFWAPEESLKSWCCPSIYMQFCAAWVAAVSPPRSVSTGGGGLGEAIGVPVAVFLPIMVMARPHLPPICISTPSLRPATTWVWHSEDVSLVPRATDSLLCSLTLTAAVFPGSHWVWGGKLWEGRRRQPGSMIPLSAWQWWLLEHSCCTSVFCLCSGFCSSHWVPR